ncbi:2-C-methyl-D-erythritol 4-phosphate cytidylyltransferase [Anaerotignum sp.]|uniref:2-C-methyl-D-erythritol 4-phosphate cytidylyltransferase n=1 Tax=Anaerotignum sp. TaxID=2039241 RepID=UPI00271548D8|nr:2-C-methyl-D-erythritol 4-phosphate cytidylyltransferase [Anaerotignum sp.]
MEMDSIVSAIIVAAGCGKRMGGQTKKQFLLLDGKEVLAHTVDRFEHHSKIQDIILVTGEDNLEDVKAMVKTYGWKKVFSVIAGGKERQDSVKRGLKVLSEKTEIVLIHDGVRPFVTQDMIERSIDAAQKCGGSVLGVAAKDTIKICDEAGMVMETPKRSTLWHIQTPQAFRKELILNAYDKAESAGFLGTDDASVAEFAGEKIKVIPGSYQNIKITTKEDLWVATCFLEEGKK